MLTLTDLSPIDVSANLHYAVCRHAELSPATRQQVAQLVDASYTQRVLNLPLYLAVLELLALGALPGFAAFEAAARHTLATRCPQTSLAQARTALRKPRPAHEPVAIAQRAGQVLSACVLTLVHNPAELPILRAMALPESALPRFSHALEVGRLCSAQAAGSTREKGPNPAPFLAILAALCHADAQGWLPDEDDIVSGGTHGVMLDMLQALGFPLTTIAPAVTLDLFDAATHPLSLSNLPRLVLGQLSQPQLQRALNTLMWRDPPAHRRISALLTQGLAQLGLPGDAAHAHDLLGLRFFYFRWHAPQTQRAVQRLERSAARCARVPS